MPRTLVRISLLYLAGNGFLAGPWAAFAPRSFYDDFPGGGMSWVSVDGPYNEHLLRDVGGLFLFGGIVALAAAIWLTPVFARSVGVGWLVFAAIHLGYHLRHLDVYPGDEQVMNVFSLSLAVVAALIAVVGPREEVVASPA